MKLCVVASHDHVSFSMNARISIMFCSCHLQAGHVLVSNYTLNLNFI